MPNSSVIDTTSQDKICPWNFIEKLHIIKDKKMMAKAC